MDILAEDWLGKPLWAWAAFFAAVFVLLAFDLGILSKFQTRTSIRRSLLVSAGYICLGLAFGGWIWWEFGPEPGLNYITGFVVEKTLAMDNIFVISLIFSYFGIPQSHQRRVLFWGVLGVLVLRGIMIGVGAALVIKFHWLLYLFSAFLVFTGIKMLWSGATEINLEQNRVIAFLRKWLRVTDQLHGQSFVVRITDPITGKRERFLTPLFMALVMIELADAVFAIDSVPAIFAITTDPFVAYTSNIFAILGLRALYFALAAMIDRFHYLSHALAVLLIFIGSKIFLPLIFGIEEISSPLSLGITAAILTTGIAASLAKPPRPSK